MWNRLKGWYRKKEIARDLVPLDKPLKMGERERLVTLKDIYEVENFDILLREEIMRHIKLIALRSKDDNEMWYFRGVIAGYQQLLKRSKHAHEWWMKEKNTL